jgi:hypothetical protein
MRMTWFLAVFLELLTERRPLLCERQSAPVNQTLAPNPWGGGPGGALVPLIASDAAAW